MRRFFNLTLLTAMLAVLPHCTSSEHPLPEERTDEAPAPENGSTLQDVTAGLTDETTNIWFVELEEPANIFGGSTLAKVDEVALFRSTAEALAVDFEERYRFTELLNGLTVIVEPAQLAALASIPNVKRLLPVGTSTMPEPLEVSEPNLVSALSMTGADVVQSELGYDGSGIKIGIIDSGVDLQHPDFGTRIITGFDFVGDAYDANDPANSIPVPEPGPGTRPGGDDCGGHGTHVAGIAAAGGDPEMGGARGVAPGASIGSYRVFGCDGSTNDDVIVSAIERAVRDGMDVINLSLGSNNGWPDDFLATALGRVLDLGVIPVASAGNNGRSGVYSIGSPGAGEQVIAVGSVDNLFGSANKLILTGGTEVGYQVLTGAPVPPQEGETAPIVFVGQGCAADDYLADPTGQVALITRGACSFAEKYLRAFEAGAIGVVVENNRPGGFNGTLGGEYDNGFGISISAEAGSVLKEMLTAGQSVTITWTAEIFLEALPTGGLASGFSSYGPLPNLGLKPDLTAPGGFIRSTYPLDIEGSNGYAVLNGTSFSSPHVAGAVALLLEARPDISPSQVRPRLQNTADPILWSGDRDLGLLEATHRQGAGLLQIDNAILNETFVAPSALALGESEAGASTHVLAVSNQSAEEVTYSLQNIAAVSTIGSTNEPEFALGTASVTFRAITQGDEPIDEVTVPAGGYVTVEATIEAPTDLPDRSVYGGYITVIPQGAELEANSAVVPYVGFKGDYQSLPAVSFQPFLADVSEEGISVLPEGTSYTMTEGDHVTVGIGLAHAVAKLTIAIIPLGENAWMGPQPVFSAAKVRRNNPGGVNTFGFGELDARYLPDGRYRIRFTLVKALGDPTNPNHVELAESPVFIIDRTPTP